MRPEEDGRGVLPPYDSCVNAMTRWLRLHPQVGDCIIAALLFVFALPMLRAPIGLSIVIALAMTLPLAVRRRYPLGVFGFVAAAAFVQWAADIPVRSQDVAILVALYTVAAYTRDRRAALLAALVTVGGAFLAVARWHEGHFPAALVAPIALSFFALALGDDRRSRRAYFADLEERAERLERERDALSQVSAAAERSRIAREMHDIIAHSLSVIVAQADGAAYTIDGDPQRARHAMVTVAETGRDALTEMRRLLGVLRPTALADELAPQPGMDEITALVDRVRDAGLPVDLVVDGPIAALPAGMELAAYRIVQEALTNTIKHSGPGATAQVAVRCRHDELEVRVNDDGAGIRSPDHDGSGQGLAGMKERAAMYGGTVQAGPLPDGGFGVAADFPLEVSGA